MVHHPYCAVLNNKSQWDGKLTELHIAYWRAPPAQRFKPHPTKSVKTATKDPIHPPIVPCASHGDVRVHVNDFQCTAATIAITKKSRTDVFTVIHRSARRASRE